MQSCSACSRSLRYSISSLAAVLVLPKLQTPQKYGRYGRKRPFGPAGNGGVQHLLPTSGLSRTATAQADGGLKMSALLPEMRARLFEASSQEYTSPGKCGISLFMYSSAARTPSDLTVTSPLALTSSAPKLAYSEPTQSTASLSWPMGNPNGYPALLHFSAAVRNVSQFH